MAVVVITRPEGVNEEMYDAVQEKLGNDMPEGMIVHTSGRNDEGVFQIVDVWESREAHGRFAQDRLMPAINAVMQDMGMDQMQGPPRDQTTYETHNVMGPAVAAAH
jgi:hypothetical protein